MKLTIQKHIETLSGKCTFESTSLQANIESIEFEIPLIMQDFYSFCDTLEEFKKAYIDLFKNQQTLFFKQAAQYFYSTLIKTPVIPIFNSKKSYLSLSGRVHSRKKKYWSLCLLVFQTGFLAIILFVCEILTLDNTIVYSTDHETYF